MPVTQTIQSSVFTASTGQSATLSFAVPAGKYNRALNGFSVSSTNKGGSGILVDGGRYIKTISFDYTVASSKSSTSGSITALPFQLDVRGGPYISPTAYSFGFGDAQNGVTLPNTLVLPDDFYKDLVGGCTVTLTLTPTYCTDIYGAKLNYHLLNSVVVGGFGYLPTSADPNFSPGSPFVCTDAPSEQALHFTGSLGQGILANRGSQYTSDYPPYTFTWSDGASDDGTVQAVKQGQQDTPLGPDANGYITATSTATFAVTRKDPGLNQSGYPNFTPDIPWHGTVTITDSDFVPNVWTLPTGDTPARPCTMGANITTGPPSAAFAQDGKLAYTATATGGFVLPVTFQWGVNYKNSEGNVVPGEYGYYAGSIVTEDDSQTIIFSNFSQPPPGYGFGIFDVACRITDSDHFGPCSHVATASPNSTYNPAPTTTTPTFGALEMDRVRQWLHVGASGGVVQTHYADGAAAFTGQPISGVDTWVRLRADPRGASLVMLGVAGYSSGSGTFTVFRSTDGGQTAVKAGSTVASSSLIELLSERGRVVWLTAAPPASDATKPPLVSTAFGTYQSDGTLAFAAPAPAMLTSTGKQLTGTLLDMDYDPRSDTLFLLTDSATLRSKDAGLTWAT